MSSKLNSVGSMLTSVDSLFTTQAERDDMVKPKVEEISLDLIDGFEGHPFSVKDDEDMQNLMRSVAERGVLVPCLARQNGGRYELIAEAEATLEKKKMVVNALINRIEVFRDYKVKIDFNFDFEQFTNGLDTQRNKKAEQSVTALLG